MVEVFVFRRDSDSPAVQAFDDILEHDQGLRVPIEAIGDTEQPPPIFFGAGKGLHGVDGCQARGYRQQRCQNL
jgi:hypothetical protein